jgi:hypothetical protein
MKNSIKSSTGLALSLALFACSSEPRTVPYFQKNIEEARAVVADTENCLGLDPTKVFTGTDECTNAHIAVKKWETAKYNQERREANARAMREGRFMPVVNR